MPLDLNKLIEPGINLATSPTRNSTPSQGRLDLSSLVEGGSAFDDFAKNQVSSQEMRAEWESKGEIGWWEYAKRQRKLDLFPVLGIAGMAEDIATMRSAERLIENNYDSESERDTDWQKIKAYALEEEEKAVRGLHWGAKVYSITSNIPALIGEVLLTKGAYTATKVATQKGIQKAVGVGTKKIASRVAGAAAGTAVRTSVLPHRYLGGYAERRLNEHLAITDKGDLLLQEAESKPAITFAKAWGDAFIEHFSELSGGAITPIRKNLGKQLSRHIPENLASRLWNDLKKVFPEGELTKMLKKGQWHGVIEEYGEERLGALLKAFTGVDDRDIAFLDKVNQALFPDAEQALVELGAFAIFGGGSMAAQSLASHWGSNGMDQVEIEARLQSMSELEKEELVTEIDNISNQQITPEENIIGTEENIGFLSSVELERARERFKRETREDLISEFAIEEINKKTEVKEISDIEIAKKLNIKGKELDSIRAFNIPKVSKEREDSFKGIRPENIVHLNQGANERVSLIVDSLDKNIIEGVSRFRKNKVSLDSLFISNLVSDVKKEKGFKTDKRALDYIFERADELKGIARNHANQNHSVVLNLTSKPSRDSLSRIKQAKKNLEKLNSETTPLELPKETSKKTIPFKKSDNQIIPKETTKKLKNRLGLGVQEKAIANNLTELFEGLPEYDQVNIKDQAQKAANLIKSNEELAIDIALGNRSAPEGVLPESLFVAVENAAIQNQNIDLLDALSKGRLVSEATVMGQRLRMLAERKPYSAVSAMQKARSNLESNFQVKNKSTSKNARKENVQKIKSEIKKNSPKAKDWSAFIDSIRCK